MREMKPEKLGKRASPALMNSASVSERGRGGERKAASMNSMLQCLCQGSSSRRKPCQTGPNNGTRAGLSIDLVFGVESKRLLEGGDS